MSGLRTDLQKTLEETIGNENVYFSPPSNIELNFPCIIYQLSGKRTDHADNIKYRKLNRYLLTVIDENPDSSIPTDLEDLIYCSFNRFYVNDNLNHWVYDLYF